MQEDTENLQAELDEKVYDVAAGGGAVKIKITGKLEVQNIEIDPEVVDPDDVEMLQDLIVAACNEAMRQVDEMSETKMNAVTGGMGLGF